MLGGVAAAFAASRLSVPVLVAFLGLGMLLGSEGPGGIEFDNPDLARTVGVVSLVAILFEGGLTTAWRRLRPVVAAAAILGTAGVVVTTLLSGFAAYFLFDLSPLESLLLGAVVASTDSAAVFATLRFMTLRRRLARLLEAESGLNDPMAVALTIGFIEWIDHTREGAGGLMLLLVRQLGLGLIVGLALGMLAVQAFERIPDAVAPFAPVASVATAAIAFGAADVIGGSGFMAVYIVGLWLGNSASPLRRQLVAFHQGLAFLAQVTLFVVLGLLVFPGELVDVVLPGLALVGVLSFVARPVAVWLTTAYQGFSTREKSLLAWAGLRGAVPIVLGTFALSADLDASNTVFNAVFFVVLVSAVLQGPTIEPLARRLGLATSTQPVHHPPLEIVAVKSLGSDLLEFTVHEGDAIDGRPVRELALPREALVAVIVRGGEAIPPRGSTVIRADDRLYVLARRAVRPRIEALFDVWEDQRQTPESG